jgi:hypothetical protein
MREVAPAAAASETKPLVTGPWKKRCSPVDTPSYPASSAARASAAVAVWSLLRVSTTCTRASGSDRERLRGTYVARRSGDVLHDT